LADLVSIVIKIGRERERYPCRRQFRAAVPKRILYRLGQILSIERKRAGQDFEIVEVLHATVGDPQFHYRFEFFGGDRLPRIGKQARTGKFEQRGIGALHRRRSDGISKTDVTRTPS